MGRSRKLSREYLEALIIAGIFLGFSNTFVVKTFFIPSASMEDTLLVGDHLFVNRFIYGAAPDGKAPGLLPMRPIRRGDVVIFRSPKEPQVDMVKRCVGLPGDEIEIRDKDLYVNGRWVDDARYTRHTDPQVFPDRPGLREVERRRDNMPRFRVPEGHFFCMGDNRDQSYDSRYWGGVPAEFIKGRAFLIYWSYGGETSDGKWRGYGRKIAQLGRTLAGFLTKSRWERTFHLIR